VPRRNVDSAALIGGKMFDAYPVVDAFARNFLAGTQFASAIMLLN
jgi:ribosomal protein L9